MGGISRHSTASYRIIADTEGSRYRFFCDLSGIAVCTSEPMREGTADDMLQKAWEREGKQHFNLCQSCGRWVSDVMYNADVLQCVDCAPWEDVPRYCRKCGAKAETVNTVCGKCGERLRYGEVRYDGFGNI